MSKIISYVPDETKPFKANYDCPISDQINVKQYNVTIDADSENNQVYLNLGYDHNRQYDCSFFLEAEDAFKLANKLLSYASTAITNNNQLRLSQCWIDGLVKLLKNKAIIDIGIKCIRLYSDDPEDSLFGNLVLQIYYTTKYSNEIEEAIIVSDNMRDKQEDYFEEVERILKEEYKVENVFIDKDGFKFLIQSMEIKLNKWIKKNKKKNPPKQYIEPMIPNNLKDSVRDIANRVMQNMNTEDNK